MKRRLWLLERDSSPPCHCPFEPPDTVVIGLNMIGVPPGQVVGEFSLDEKDGVQIRLYTDAERKAQEGEDVSIT